MQQTVALWSINEILGSEGSQPMSRSLELLPLELNLELDQCCPMDFGQNFIGSYWIWVSMDVDTRWTFGPVLLNGLGPPRLDSPISSGHHDTRIERRPAESYPCSSGSPLPPPVPASVQCRRSLAPCRRTPQPSNSAVTSGTPFVGDANPRSSAVLSSLAHLVVLLLKTSPALGSSPDRKEAENQCGEFARVGGGAVDQARVGDERLARGKTRYVRSGRFPRESKRAM